ncbi:hypothetical protein [Cellulomonas iranensis]|uniref:Uncharacterized protein n=1 Tax=Cellulomonas iranensis TaxID=76862 RepID=A0ABU0GMW1_9CELL|nr:hypothetical protein [Cellulomonas iranensis]MDQ0426051.1 hypothetical protein [Cellulomonas iranensis]
MVTRFDVEASWPELLTYFDAMQRHAMTQLLASGCHEGRSPTVGVWRVRPTGRAARSTPWSASVVRMPWNTGVVCVLRPAGQVLACRPTQ